MALDHVGRAYRLADFGISFAGKLICQRLSAIHHSWTYKATSDPKNIVVVGGSFAGVELVKRLIEIVPTGYRVVLIEKNSHFNYSFNFPRYSVIEGHEHNAFIPFDGLSKSALDGIYKHVQDRVASITDTQILLASGESLDYEYLVIATGSSSPPPTKAVATERRDACLELRNTQTAVKKAKKIAIVGAGAVGVELATDIKDVYPDKEVTLIHSRGQILNQFGKSLHEYVMSALADLDVRVLLNERPEMSFSGGIGRNEELTFSDGRTESFDLIVSTFFLSSRMPTDPLQIACTGQRPNSQLLERFHPETISKETSRILVKPTLQIATAERIFAVGDVAEHGGPRMARAVYFQSNVVADNIGSMLRGRVPSAAYVPMMDIEGSIKLTLGLNHRVAYMPAVNGGSDVVFGSKKKGNLDLEAPHLWWRMGASMSRANDGLDDQVVRVPGEGTS